MDSVISTSKKAASYLVKEPDAIIPHGVDLKRFSAPINKEDSWDKLNFPGTLGIGIFGRVRHSKGIDILVDAAINILPNYPSATVIICGETQIEDQPYKKKIISKIKKANLEDRIIFLGKKWMI